jgi:U3 small nucleolar RNA-associated protein 22
MAGIKAKRKLGELTAGAQDATAADEESNHEAGSYELTSAHNERPYKMRKRLHQATRQTEFTGGTFIGEIYRSNMFKLQVDELLSQLKPSLHHVEKRITAALHHLKSTIEAIPEKEHVTVRSLDMI